MEAVPGQALQFPTWSGSWRIRGKPNVPLGFNQRCRKELILQVANLNGLHFKNVSFQKKSSYSGSETLSNSFDKTWLLKTKAEITPCLGGRSIFLVGMMGSGKTTVGKMLSESLGYSFVDSDKYVEQDVCGTSVCEIFKQFGESFFRQTESQALQKLSQMSRQVVATGGGAVVQPINWKYMREGITVYLDVPLDSLARRIAAVGTNSRPLLHFESGDPYTKAFMGLFTLSKKRSEAYNNADITISLINLAANIGVEDLSDVTPAAIAVEVLVQIEKLLTASKGMSTGMFL